MIRYEQAWVAKPDSLMTTEQGFEQLFNSANQTETPFQELFCEGTTLTGKYLVAFQVYFTEIGFGFALQLKNATTGDIEWENVVGSVYDTKNDNITKIATILDFLAVSEVKVVHTKEGKPKEFRTFPPKPFKSINEQKD